MSQNRMHDGDQKVLYDLIYGHSPVEVSPHSWGVLDRAYKSLYPLPHTGTCPLCHAGVDVGGVGHSPICALVGQAPVEWPVVLSVEEVLA